jgi:hypothetical protein
MDNGTRASRAGRTPTGHHAARSAQITLSGHQPDGQAADRAAVPAAQRTLSRNPGHTKRDAPVVPGVLPGGADEVSGQPRPGILPLALAGQQAQYPAWTWAWPMPRTLPLVTPGWSLAG